MICSNIVSRLDAVRDLPELLPTLRGFAFRRAAVDGELSDVVVRRRDVDVDGATAQRLQDQLRLGLFEVTGSNPLKIWS